MHGNPFPSGRKKFAPPHDKKGARVDALFEDGGWEGIGGVGLALVDGFLGGGVDDGEALAVEGWV